MKFALSLKNFNFERIPEHRTSRVLKNGLQCIYVGPLHLFMAKMKMKAKMMMDVDGCCFHFTDDETEPRCDETICLQPPTFSLVAAE